MSLENKKLGIYAKVRVSRKPLLAHAAAAWVTKSTEMTSGTKGMHDDVMPTMATPGTVFEPRPRVRTKIQGLVMRGEPGDIFRGT